MLCPDCGVETHSLVEGSCPRCFVRRHEIAKLPPHVDVMLCAQCNARREGESWADPGDRTREDMVDEAVVKAVRHHERLESPHVEVASQARDKANFHYEVMVDGTVGDLPVDTMLETMARIKQGVCQSCSRQAGGYFSAILQFRATDREPSDDERQEAGAIVINAIDAMKKAGNQNAFVTKQGKVKGGHDFYLSEIDVGRIVAKRIAERFDASVQESAKLMGQQEGKNVYRVTFLIRMPPYRRGDFVDLGRGPARVQEVHAKTLSLRMLSDGRSVTVPRDQVLPAQVVAKRQDARQMMVVSVVRDEALLLDPVTNKTHEVRLPDDIEYDLSIRHLDVIEHDDQVYLVGVPKKGLPLV